MKLALGLCLVLSLFCGPAAAADVAVARSGAWSAPKTWDSGVPPGPGDTVTVAGGVVLTVDGDHAVAGMQVHGRAEVVLAPGARLTVHGDSAWGVAPPRLGLLTLGEGSQFIHHGVMSVGALRMRTRGTTAGRPAVFGGGGSVASAVRYRSDIDVSRVVFAMQGAISFSGGQRPDSEISEKDAGNTLRDCVILPGGRMSLGGTARSARQLMTGCDVVDRDIDLNGADVPPDAKGIARCTFRRTGPGAGSVRIQNSSGAFFDGNVVVGYRVSGTAATTHRARGNLYAQLAGRDGDAIVSFGTGPGQPGGEISGNYAVTGIVNSHGFSGGSTSAVNTVSGNVIEVLEDASGGPNMVMAGSYARLVEGNVFLFRKLANVAGMAGNVAPAGGVTIRRNTVYATASRTGDPILFLTEQGSGNNYEGPVEVHSNLVAAAGPVQAPPAGLLMGGSGAADDVFSGPVGHNFTWNMSGDPRYVGAVAHDLRARDAAMDTPPGFADPGRSLAAWAQARHGTDGTLQAALDAFLGINGFDPASGTQTGPAFGGTVDEAVAWVRAGFVPSNPALAGGGYGGVDVGAMDVAGGE